MFSTDSTGTPFLGHVWNTQGSDGPWNLYLRDPSTSAWVNSGNGAGASISVPITPGSYNFSLDAEYSFVTLGYIGLGLFFDGAPAPGISVYIPVNGGPVLPISSGIIVRDMAGQLIVPSAGTDTYNVPGDVSVHLTGFSWALSEGTDNVGAYDNTPSGSPDYIGTLSLDAESLAPEPSTLPLAGGALLALLAGIRRRGRRLPR